MSTPPSRPPNDDSADEAFETFLDDADAELLEHVRSHAHPSRALTSLLGMGEEPGPSPLAPADSAEHSEQAVLRIRGRFAVQDLMDELFGVVDLLRRHDFAGEFERRLAEVRDLIRGRARVRDNARLGGIARVLTRLHLLARDLDDLLARVDTCVDDLARIRDLASGRDFVRDFARIRDLVRDLGNDRSNEFARDIIRTLERDLDRDRALGLARRLDLVLDLGRDLVRIQVRARAVARDLTRQPVDVSGVDLSGVLAGRVAASSALVLLALAGVVWDDATRWPPGLRQLVEDRSEPIAPGRYQVRRGTERDPHEAART